ncbi:SOSS complex subunit C isoform X3 [Arvicanthis niloticus]|uniref:SOSS complex subunit C isoform X3 n=1 Tax=Arvicanthis niloticus TaxID=61156 RepID=UPI00402B84A6
MLWDWKVELALVGLELAAIHLSRSPEDIGIKGFQNKNRVAILAELDKEKRKLLMQNQSSASHPGASISLSRPSLNKDFRDHAEQQHIAAQQKAALQHAHAHSSGYFITQDSAFGNLILPVLPRLDPE